MKLTIEFNEGLVGEWHAKVIELPDTVAYGETPRDALAQVQALALHAVAGMVERRELPPEQVIAFNQIFNELEGEERRRPTHRRKPRSEWRKSVV